MDTRNRLLPTKERSDNVPTQSAHRNPRIPEGYIEVKNLINAETNEWRTKLVRLNPPKPSTAFTVTTMLAGSRTREQVQVVENKLPPAAVAPHVKMAWVGPAAPVTVAAGKAMPQPERKLPIPQPPTRRAADVQNHVGFDREQTPLEMSVARARFLVWKEKGDGIWGWQKREYTPEPAAGENWLGVKPSYPVIPGRR